MDAYAAVVAHMTYHHYRSVTHYRISAVLRNKLGQAIHARGRLAPHIFETLAEAEAAIRH